MAGVFPYDSARRHVDRRTTTAAAKRRGQDGSRSASGIYASRNESPSRLVAA